MYHFIGIAGAGMSSLAQIMYSLGYKVKGSDISTEFFTTEKLDKNIKIDIFNKENITKDLIIVQGNSFGDDNPEVKRAKELNLKIFTYQEMVGKLTRQFSTISISGCHGKTTTTSMLSHVLGNITGTNYLIGDGNGYADEKNEYFVLEACEYMRHFLSYVQKYAVITNIDLDHVDYYKDINDMVDAYSSFINNTDKNVIAYGDDKHTRKFSKDKKILYYGFEENNDYVAKNIIYDITGTTFDVYEKEKYLNTFFIKLGGKHMVANALAVIIICYLEGVSLELVKKELSTFSGARRRFAVEEIDSNIIVDDYAHHPTEIRATIEAAKQKYPNKKLVAIFQPHTFSRTEKFMNEFIEILSKCDYSYILNIHPSREKQEDFPGLSSKQIVDKVSNSSHIEISNADSLLKHKDSVFLFLSPNSLNELINDYKNKANLNPLD